MAKATITLKNGEKIQAQEAYEGDHLDFHVNWNESLAEEISQRSNTTRLNKLNALLTHALSGNVDEDGNAPDGLSFGTADGGLVFISPSEIASVKIND